MTKELEDIEMTELNGQIIEAPVFTFKGVQLISKKTPTPLKLLIYGTNGVGKSTFASKSKSPIFLDLEGNVDHLDCPRYGAKTLGECYEFINYLIDSDHSFKTLVIDSADVLEALILKSIKESKDERSLGYGKDIVFAKEEMYRLLSKMDDLRDIKNVRIIFTAKSIVKRCENPLTEVYDKYELRMNEKVAGILCDWVHCILFAVNDLTFGSEDIGFNKKRKLVSQNDRRIIYTEGNTAYVAKNVFNLPHKMPLDWNEFESGIKKFFSNKE